MGKVDKFLERGTAYLEGVGVARDYEQAFYWLSTACELGSDKAESMLRDMRRMSLGAPFVDEDDEATSTIRADETLDNRLPQSQESQSGNNIGRHSANASMQSPANPNRCIACGMEALVPSAAIHGAKHCSPDLGGCGTTLMIPIVESGLDRGIALQPYREKMTGQKEVTYSSLGLLVHMVKYDTRVEDSLKADMITEIARRIGECGIIEQLVGGMRNDLVIVPAPSSKRRKVQPVHLLAQSISEGRYRFDNAMTKRSNIESKSRPSGTELAPGDVRCNDSVYGKAILFVDDTYGEGATLRACIRALREKGAGEVYFLSLCKNIFGGMKGSVAYDDDLH